MYLVLGGVLSPRRVYLVPGACLLGGVCLGGVSAQGGHVCWGGGMSAGEGACLPGVYLPRYSPPMNWSGTLPHLDRQIPVNLLLCPKLRLRAVKIHYLDDY